jgi:hypothetical protein
MRGPSAPRSDGGGVIRYWCRCDCGTERLVTVQGLRAGRSKSCGCRVSELSRKRKLTHGLSDSRLYRVWGSIVDRCCNLRSPYYHRYGGRRIGLYTPWRTDPKAFIDYVETTLGPRPSKQHSIDRINNDGNYEPGNLRWATRSEQAQNRRITEAVIDNCRRARLHRTPKISLEQCAQIKSNHSDSAHQLALQYGVSESRIRDLRPGRFDPHGGYKLTKKQVGLIKTARLHSRSELAQLFSVSWSTIRYHQLPGQG